MIIPDQDINRISENNVYEYMSFIGNKKIPAKKDELNEPSISTLFKNTIEEMKENEAPKLFKNDVSHNIYINKLYQ